MSQDNWEGKVDGRYSVAILQIISISILMLFSPDVISKGAINKAITYFIFVYGIGYFVTSHLAEKPWRDSVVIYGWTGYIALGGLIVYLYPNFVSDTPRVEITKSLRVFSLYWLGTLAILLGFRPFRYLRTIALLIIAYVVYNNMAYMVQLSLPTDFWFFPGTGPSRDHFFIANGMKSLVMAWLFLAMIPTIFEALRQR